MVKYLLKTPVPRGRKKWRTTSELDHLDKLSYETKFWFSREVESVLYPGGKFRLMAGYFLKSRHIYGTAETQSSELKSRQLSPAIVPAIPGPVNHMTIEEQSAWNTAESTTRPYAYQ